MSKKYEADLIARGIPKENIYKYGFAFRGKEVLVGHIFEASLCDVVGCSGMRSLTHCAISEVMQMSQNMIYLNVVGKTE